MYYFYLRKKEKKRMTQIICVSNHPLDVRYECNSYT